MAKCDFIYMRIIRTLIIRRAVCHVLQYVGKSIDDCWVNANSIDCLVEV